MAIRDAAGMILTKRMAVTALVPDLQMPQCLATVSVYQAALVRHVVRMDVVETAVYVAQTRFVQAGSAKAVQLTIAKASALKVVVMEIR